MSKRISLKTALREDIPEALVRGPLGFTTNVIGAEPLPLERAHHILSRLIEREKNPDYVSISWASQVAASGLCPDLKTALKEILKRDPSALD